MQRRIIDIGRLASLGVLSIALFACSSSDKTGGDVGSLNAKLTLDAGEVVKQFDAIAVTLSCSGIDPVTNAPRPEENFDVNVSTTEGSDPKDQFGIFQKEGLPPGACSISMSTASTDGQTQCSGQMNDIMISANQTTNVSIVLNCITEARYGGVRVDGTFNQCAEYRQVLVSPLVQSSGNDIDVELWAYDPDGDPVMGGVQFVSATTGMPCGTVTPEAQAAPSDGTTSVSFAATCDAPDQCLILVGVSDDGFTSCDATNDAANAVVPVECQASQACGDGVVTPPEQCDPPDGVFCSDGCRDIDPCADPNACPSLGECQTNTCTGGDPTDNSPLCQAGNQPNGTSCSDPAGGTCTDGVCGLCVSDAQCAPATDCRAAGSCDPSTGCQEGAPTNEGGSCTDPATMLPGTCSAGTCDVPGACTNPGDISIINDPEFRGVITSCGFGEFGGGPPVDECLQDTLGLSVDCSGCWQGFFNCTVQNCAGLCAANPNAPACVTCLQTNCQAATEACTGLPVPL